MTRSSFVQAFEDARGTAVAPGVRTTYENALLSFLPLFEKHCTTDPREIELSRELWTLIADRNELLSEQRKGYRR